MSLAVHLALLGGVPLAPAPPWSWLLHAGAVLGFWWAWGRITAAGLTGVSGLFRIRRMVPVPVRLCLGAATANALVAAWLAGSGRGVPGQALSAYWTMMYLLVTILFGFVVLRPTGGRVSTPAPPSGVAPPPGPSPSGGRPRPVA